MNTNKATGFTYFHQQPMSDMVPEARPGYGVVVILDRRYGAKHYYERSVAGVPEDKVHTLLHRTAALAQSHLDAHGDIHVADFAGCWDQALASLSKPCAVGPDPAYIAREFMTSLGITTDHMKVGFQGLPEHVKPHAPLLHNYAPPNLAALVNKTVDDAYAAAAALMARAEAEMGARVGPLRTAPPLPTANILRGMR